MFSMSVINEVREMNDGFMEFKEETSLDENGNLVINRTFKQDCKREQMNVKMSFSGDFMELTEDVEALINKT